jgi:hypothetical protein
MRSPDDDPLQPVTGCCALLQLLLRCEHLDRAFLARPKQDHALQTPQAEWTNLIVERETVLIFGHRHRLAARRENIPYEILLRRMFSSSNLKRTQYTKNGLSNLVTATPLSPPMSEMGPIVTEIGCARDIRLPPPKAAGAPDVPARSGGGLVWPRPSNAWARLARLGQSTQPLTSWRCGRGVSCLEAIMADKSKFSIVTYQRSPGHWRAAITPFVHSGPFIRGRTTTSFVTPDDYASEPDATIAAEQLIGKL